MALRVKFGDVEAHLADYVARAANFGERVAVENDGELIAALVSPDDLHRLETSDSTFDKSKIEGDKRFLHELEQRGVVVRFPAERESAGRTTRQIHVDGPPISEQIIADRR